MFKTFILAALAAFSLLGCNAPEQDVQIPLRISDGVFAEVCAELATVYEQLDCSSIKPPILIATRVPKVVNSIGLYVKGEPYVFVDYTDPKRAQALVHETVHYIIYELRLSTDRCEAERVARTLTNDDNSGWRETYGCPTKAGT